MTRVSLLSILTLLAACGGSPPALPTLSITPLFPTTVDDLVAVLGESVDRRGDPLEHSLVWTVDGVAAEIDGATVPASATAKGQVWVASVTATDGRTEVGPVQAQVVIGNSPPIAERATITPDEPTTLDTLTCAATALPDADGDPVTFDYAWTVDDASAGVGATLASAAFVKGQTAVCIATPHDGEDDGAPAQAQVVIVNSPPGAAEILITPAAPAAGVDPLFCDIAAPAPDADDDELTYHVTWTVDGATYPDDFPQATGPTTTNWPSDTVPAADTSLGSSWTCAVTADDGEDRGPAATASVQVISGCTELVVGALPGWGTGHTDGNLRWTRMLEQQATFGACQLSIVSISAGFTLETLLDRGVEVVLIPNVAGGSTTYTSSEQAAIQAFVDGGHGGVVATYLLRLSTYGWPGGAALFGVDPGVLADGTDPVDTRVDVREVGHDLMTGLEVRSFTAGGHPFAQRTTLPWADALLTDTTIIADNGAAAVIAHDGDHRGVWITWMVEYQTTTDDGLRLMYNSLVWAGGYRP